VNRTKVARDYPVRCVKCGWRGNLSQMILYPTIRGPEPRGCPACKAENRPCWDKVVVRVYARKVGAA